MNDEVKKTAWSVLAEFLRLIPLAGALLVGGMAWGEMNNRVKNLEDDQKDVTAVQEAVQEQRIVQERIQTNQSIIKENQQKMLDAQQKILIRLGVQ